MKTTAKRIAMITWSLWCAAATFLTPIIATFTYLCITGKVYEYDSTFDQGTAGLIGTLILILWLTTCCIPTLLYLKKLTRYGRKTRYTALAIIVLLLFICYAICDWNIITFITR